MKMKTTLRKQPEFRPILTRATKSDNYRTGERNRTRRQKRETEGSPEKNGGKENRKKKGINREGPFRWFLDPVGLIPHISIF